MTTETKPAPRRPDIERERRQEAILRREAEEHALRHALDMEVEEDPGGGIRLRTDKDAPRRRRRKL